MSQYVHISLYGLKESFLTPSSCFRLHFALFNLLLILYLHEISNSSSCQPPILATWLNLFPHWNHWGYYLWVHTPTHSVQQLRFTVGYNSNSVTNCSTIFIGLKIVFIGKTSNVKGRKWASYVGMTSVITRIAHYYEAWCCMLWSKLQVAWGKVALYICPHYLPYSM